MSDFLIFLSSGNEVGASVWDLYNQIPVFVY